jgi:hypothetical protein
MLGGCLGGCDANLATKRLGSRKSPQSLETAVYKGFRSGCPEVSILGTGMGESVPLSPTHFIRPRARTVQFALRNQGRRTQQIQDGLCTV